MLFILLTGAPHSGKSTWLEHFLSEHDTKRAKIIDIYHVQNQLVLNTEEDIANAYILMMQELKFTLTEHHDEFDYVVVEAPLITQEQRKLFLNVFSANKQNNDFSLLIWCETDPKTLQKRLNIHNEQQYDINELLEQIERPTNAENFDFLSIVKNEGINDTYINLARIHCGYSGSQYEEAKTIIDDFENGKISDYSRGLIFVIEDQS